MTDDSDDWKRIHALCTEGRAFSAQEASELEKHVQTSPADLDARAKLTGYYEQQWMSRVESSPDAFTGDERKRFGLPDGYFKHALYFIEHVPESEYVRMCTHSIHRPLNPVGYEDARNIWMQHLGADPDNLDLIRNAQRFFVINEPEVAEELLLRGKKLDPENPEWPDALSHFYNLSRRRKRGDARAKALSEKGVAIQLKGAEVDGADFSDAALLAFIASDFEKADQYAKRAIEIAAGERRSPALHFGHTVLGRLALIHGDLGKAKEHLLASADVEKYPTLSSFGPTMTLAKELLEANEREVVLEYFERCSKFWGYGSDRLDKWASEVRAARIPDFESNLRE